MDFDEVTRTHKSATDAWIRQLAEFGASGVEKLASKYNSGKSCECVAMKNGSFNLCFKVIFDATREAWAVRFPIPGKVMYPEEKVRREATVLRFIEQNTRIPTPKFIACGTAIDNHDPRIGPFIITEWVEGVTLASIMKEQPESEWGPTLRKDMDDKTLYKIYRQMAGILLELSMHDFDKIGALSEVKQDDGRFTWCVSARPMTVKMNEIESKGYVAMHDYTLASFSTVPEYMQYLLQQNVDHVLQQRNSVDDENDARHKYTLREQAKRLVMHFISKDYASGPFKLFCDDLQPGNVIVEPETLKVIALIDLEWTYTAPYQFLFSPPPWLILEKPNSWTTYGMEHYDEKFQMFIKCLEDEEAVMEKEGHLRQADHRMSTLMRGCMEDGTFWFMQLLRDAFNFDGEVVWPTVKSFLNVEDLAALEITDEAQKADMAHFVTKKMEDLARYQSDLQSSEGREGHDSYTIEASS